MLWNPNQRRNRSITPKMAAQLAHRGARTVVGAFRVTLLGTALLGTALLGTALSGCTEPSAMEEQQLQEEQAAVQDEAETL